MGMRLNADQLADIASKLEEIGTLGVEVTQFKIHGHEVYTRQEDGGAGKQHFVVGISRIDPVKEGKVIR